VPPGFDGLTLTGLRYRGMTLNLAVTGVGVDVARFELDGEARPDHSVPADLTGPHEVVVRLGGSGS
jgi:hypothetical protein